MKFRLVLAENTFFFQIFEDRVENDSLKNFSTYQQQKNWSIDLQKLFITILRNMYVIWLFPVIRKKPMHQTVLENYWERLLKKCIILRISWSLNEKDSYYKGKVLSLEIGVHGDAKEALKWFAFSLKFNISLLIKIGGVNGMFFPL